MARIISTPSLRAGLIVVALSLLLVGNVHARPDKGPKQQQPKGDDYSTQPYPVGCPQYGWVGTYWGSCTQYAYEESPGCYKCSQRPVSFPFYITISNQGITPNSYFLSWARDQTTHYSDGKSYSVEEAEYSQLPLFYEYYRNNAYCMHVNYDDGSTAYFNLQVYKKAGQYVLVKEGEAYLDGTFSDCCPNTSFLSLYCSENTSTYSYRCTAYKVDDQFPYTGATAASAWKQPDHQATADRRHGR